MSVESSREAALDACLDRLIEGHEWESELPAGRDGEEVAGLMRVAELVMKMARGLPGPSVRSRTRVWRQVRGNGGSLRAAFGRLFAVRALPVPA